MYDILTAFGVPAELIPAASAAERWPGMWFGPDPVMFHPDGGVLEPGARDGGDALDRDRAGRPVP